MSSQYKIQSPIQSSGTIWLASFDIGYINFAWYIEETDGEKLSSIKNITKSVRYNDDSTPTDCMSKILDSVCNNGKTILYKNSNISTNCVKGKNDLDPETFHNMIDLLDQYASYWDKCSSFIIEKQMDFGKAKRNPKALKLGHFCESYFMFRYGRFKQVVEFPAYNKTIVLGCKKIKGKLQKNGKYKWTAVDKPTRKKWSIVKAVEILTNRDEINIIENIKQKAKRDDISDCICQLQAFKYLCFVSNETNLQI